MKQLALDIGLASSPTLENFFAGPNEAALSHLRLWTSSASRSPVPTYLWGESGCGKTHLLQAAHGALQEQGLQVGWLDAHTVNPPEFNDDWSAVVMGAREPDCSMAATLRATQASKPPCRPAVFVPPGSDAEPPISRKPPS
jgi:energy-coupling factor transporter ATP-binding protein EcfA2